MALWNKEQEAVTTYRPIQPTTFDSGIGYLLLNQLFTNSRHAFQFASLAFGPAEPIQLLESKHRLTPHELQKAQSPEGSDNVFIHLATEEISQRKSPREVFPE